MNGAKLDSYITTDPRDAEYRDDLEECACCGESLDPKEDEHENADANLAKHAGVDEGSILCLKCCEEATETAECAVNDLEDDLYDAQEDGNEEEVTRLKAAIKAAQAEAKALTANFGGSGTSPWTGRASGPAGPMATGRTPCGWHGGHGRTTRKSTLPEENRPPVVDNLIYDATIRL
jgi:hypothetical protein